jgi:HEAT repeats
MTKRLGICFVVATVVVCGAIIWHLMPAPEPRYKGKTILYWLEATRNVGELEAELSPEEVALVADRKMAFRLIGTNSIPMFVNMASRHDSALKSRLLALAIKWTDTEPDSEMRTHSKAVIAFASLGPLGKDAVPSLTNLLNSPYRDVRLTAIVCLGCIGPEAKEAVPLLVKFLDSTNRIMRADAAESLGRIHEHPELVVPQLTKALTNPNRYTVFAIVALGQFGAAARPAVPSLLPYLNSEYGPVRRETTNALQRIDPGNAALAGK